ncbi:uncharacterized protein MONOS_15277 [Monocercomonoides exilis]|uniref:uncharacterized protein n=1 Tax=Monocercomonoides exilis TaxID=2049356 RepID=UPI00355A03DB|nr:hypothetical protein MONOS_15277 [Monocercomonoides exilis]|eukprot:MONOS_15277.1-p1 / transcript=MONOS_15277.1 / gene=MONOS_15277 / organism=Monocercomonoides_exilis_PA203 / gene_product=unspecified product / transcript_product=unspecified product / location=Mono_scaffold01188:2961-3275(-) / protein_length=105 / sequence_SO=supercontig / SO=protein_coding / is_pseudo=false
MHREESDGPTQHAVGGLTLLDQQKSGRQSAAQAVFFSTPRGSESGFSFCSVFNFRLTGSLHGLQETAPRGNVPCPLVLDTMAKGEVGGEVKRTMHYFIVTKLFF